MSANSQAVQGEGAKAAAAVADQSRTQQEELVHLTQDMFSKV